MSRVSVVTSVTPAPFNALQTTLPWSCLVMDSSEISASPFPLEITSPPLSHLDSGRGMLDPEHFRAKLVPALTVNWDPT